MPRRRSIRYLLLIYLSSLCVTVARPDANSALAEIVVAIRYLQAQGTSHSHLYLYRDDGKLLRQLTDDNTGQESDPIFAPDGETIVFTREVGDVKQCWSIEPRGGNLQQLPAAPDWYAAARSSPFFNMADFEEPARPSVSGAAPKPDPAPFGERAPHFTAPDGSAELILEEQKDDEEDQLNGPEHGKHYRLRNPKTGRETLLSKLPGFEGLVDPLHLGNEETYFLWEPPLRVVFFGVHLDSTAGDTDYALDLTSRRIVRLSPNWAAPFPLPGESAFLTMTYVRYLNIPGSKKTANCSFVERWKADLSKVRFARPNAAGIVYGASIYRPERTPAVVTIRRTGD